ARARPRARATGTRPRLGRAAAIALSPRASARAPLFGTTPRFGRREHGPARAPARARGGWAMVRARDAARRLAERARARSRRVRRSPVALARRGGATRPRVAGRHAARPRTHGRERRRHLVRGAARSPARATPGTAADARRGRGAASVVRRGGSMNDAATRRAAHARHKRLRLEAFADGTLPLGPQTIHLDVTNACNTDCVTCWDHSPHLQQPP